jgi:quercetin dioxygenase-like cupin family protein
MPDPPSVRRVVTAESPDGKGVLASVEELQPTHVSESMAAYSVWGWDELPSLPHAAEESSIPSSDIAPMPGPGGARISTVVFQPNAGFPRHATDSIDAGVVISGEIDLDQDGDVVTLRQGDHFIQNGAPHGWQNRGSEPCVMAIVMFGAARKPTS